MSTHTKVRTTWLANQPVLHGEFAALDFGQFDSISCSGGTYAPAAVITVGGAGMTLTLVGASSVASGGSLTVASGAAFALASGSAASFGGTGTFLSTSVTNWSSGSNSNWKSGSTLTIEAGGEVQMSGSMFCHVGGFVEIDCAASFTGAVSVANTSTFDVACAASFDAGVTVTAGNFTVLAGITSLGGTNHIVGPTLLSAAVVTTGAGQVLSRIVLGGDANATYSKNSADVVIIDDSVLTAARTYTVDTVSAQSGSLLTFRKDTSAFDVALRTPGGALICTLSTTAGFRWVDLIFTTQWETLRFEAA